MLLMLCFTTKTQAQVIINPIPYAIVVQPNNTYSYGFENTFPIYGKSWGHSSSDDFNWVQRSGPTPSSNTGPSSAFRGNFYMYMEASGNNHPNKEAILTSPRFNLSQLNVPRVAIYTCMFGTGMGTLRLEYSLNNSNNWNLLSIRTGDQGNLWEIMSITASALSGQSNVRFRLRGTTGSTFRSDIAVDYFRISNYGSNKTDDQGQDNSFISSLEAAGFAPAAYPNPFHGELALRLEAQDSPVNVSIFSLEGKRVYNQTFATDGNDLAIESSNLPAGTYLLKATCDGVSETIRIVKQ